MLRWFALLGVSLVACGGAVAPSESTSSGSGGGGSTSSSTSGGTSSGFGGSSGSTTGEACDPEIQSGDRACVPGVAVAGVPVTIDVDSSDSCLNCFTRLTQCSVSLSGDQVTLYLGSLDCSASEGPAGCDPLCGPSAVHETCVIPALSTGTYTVNIENAGRYYEPRQLVVAPNGTGASCTLPTGDPPPIDASKYSTACEVDSDCTAVATSGLCACGGGCPGTPIAASDLAIYEADARANISQCTASAPLPCPRCPAAPVHCQTGTCVIDLP